MTDHEPRIVVAKDVGCTVHEIVSSNPGVPGQFVINVSTEIRQAPGKDCNLFRLRPGDLFAVEDVDYSPETGDCVILVLREVER